MNRLVFTSLAQRGTFGILVVPAFVDTGLRCDVLRPYGRQQRQCRKRAMPPAVRGARLISPANSVAAGDVVRVQAGTYSEIVNAGL
jgi:hypothetical protein